MNAEIRLGGVYLLNQSAPARVARVIQTSPFVVVAELHRELPALEWVDIYGFPGLSVRPAAGDSIRQVDASPAEFWGWISLLVAFTHVPFDQLERAGQQILDHIPTISAELWEQLSRIEPSRDGETEYRPARVQLSDGTARDPVVFADADQWTRIWSFAANIESSVAIEDIRRIEETHDRLPPEIANRLYWESAMGGTFFTVTLADGRRFAVGTGNQVDIVRLPDGVTPDMIIEDVPHDQGEGLPTLETPDLVWCLYRRV
jgi:hypothetical protein